MRSVGRFLLVVVVVAGLSATGLVGPPPASSAARREPVYHVDRALLKAALHCPDTFTSRRHPVLLVHGTFARGEENWGWNYLPELTERGFDVCYLDLPDRSVDDIQLSSEYVVFALRKIHRLTGKRVDILGHSQGGLQPRWALRWWPSLRTITSDLVTLATPNHGTQVAAFQAVSCEACIQMGPNSNFLAALNSADETPGKVEYTNIYTELIDELVVPATSAETNGATNISIQDVCPARPVDHVTIAADAAVLAMVIDAFTHKGTTAIGRLPADLCLGNPLFPDDPAQGIALLQGALDGDPDLPEGFEPATEEPALRGYTQR